MHEHHSTVHLGIHLPSSYCIQLQASISTHWPSSKCHTASTEVSVFRSALKKQLRGRRKDELCASRATPRFVTYSRRTVMTRSDSASSGNDAGRSDRFLRPFRSWWTFLRAFPVWTYLVPEVQRCENIRKPS